MNYVVTGANGFIGRSLTKFLLEKGHFVYAIVTNETDMESLKCENLKIIVAYFEDYLDIKKHIKPNSVDVLFHLAWSGLAGEPAYDVDTQLNNVSITNRLLISLKDCGLKKVILASTMNKLEIIDSILNPGKNSMRKISVHVASKINAEVVSRVFCESNGIEFNDALIAMAYGERNKSKMIVNVFLLSLLNGVTPKLIEGKNTYDLIYIDDIVSGLYSIATKGRDKQTYYIGHSFNKTFKDWFTEIKNIINKDAVVEFGGYPEDNHINFELVDRQLLTKDTGWVPSADFAESIIKTANWIKKNKQYF